MHNSVPFVRSRRCAAPPSSGSRAFPPPRKETRPLGSGLRIPALHPVSARAAPSHGGAAHRAVARAGAFTSQPSKSARGCDVTLGGHRFYRLAAEVAGWLPGGAARSAALSKLFEYLFLILLDV